MSTPVPAERTDVADQTAALLAHPLRGVTVGQIEELVRIVGAEVQLAESLVHDLITERLLSTAVGVQLDQWGARLGLARTGMGDDDYRAALRTWIMVLLSDGCAERICEIVRRFSGASTVIYRQAGMAHFVVTYDVATATTAQRRLLINQALELATLVGVSWTATEGLTAGYFGFSGNPDPNCKGFGEGGLSALVSQANP
jgi:hypothetical protein